MSETDWDAFERWHLLFDALCRERGHPGNASLASQLCARSGKGRREDFEAARKQLRTWRSGARLPLRRNVSMLGQLLGIERAPDLERQWVELYRRAQAARAGRPSAAPSQVGEIGRHPRWRRFAAAGVLLLGLAMLVMAVPIMEGRRAGADLPIVNFEGMVRVPVGMSVLIHGHPGGCDGAAPAWRDIAADMPVSRLGLFSDGGLARKIVRRCAGERIVRAVMFKGIEPGTEGIRLLGDYIRVDVVAPR